MASLTRWIWIWVNSGNWWWTGRPGVLRFMGSQRVGHDWATDLNWTDGTLVNGPFVERCFTSIGMVDIAPESLLLLIHMCSYHIKMTLVLGERLVYFKYRNSTSHVQLSVTPWAVVHGILQARILEGVTVPFTKGYSQLRDQTQISHIAGRFFTSWAIRETQEYWIV